MEVTVKKTPQTGDCLHFILLVVGVASVAKCWWQNHQISLLRGVVLSQATFHLVIYATFLNMWLYFQLSVDGAVH